MFHWKLSMLTAAVKRDGVKPGMQTWVLQFRERERARETEEREKERQYVFMTGWLTVGFWGRYQRVLDQKRGRERERERGVDESFCNLCATDDFPSALFTLTHSSLESLWDVTVNQREDDSKTHREGLSETECELDAT